MCQKYFLPSSILCVESCPIPEPLRTSVTCTAPVPGPVEDIRTSSQVEPGDWDTPGPAMTTPPPTLPDSLDKLSLLLILVIRNNSALGTY